MALSPGTLAAELTPVFGGTDSFVSAGAEWARAYKKYAETAQAGLALPIFTGVEEAVLAASLAAAFAAGIAAPAATPDFMEAAFIAFWMAPPVVFGAGVVTVAPPGLAVLIRATFPVNLLAATASAASAVLAGAIDVWTRTVTVTLPGPTVVTLL